jgi:hypothetical protein
LGGELTLVRSLVSGNTASGYAEIVNEGANLNAANYNVFGNSELTNAGAFGNFTPGATDITATSDGTNPTALVGILNTTLADNGGPTQTHALVAGSPAIDLGPSSACTAAVDQRGEARNVDGNGAASENECDAGAYEYKPPVAPGVCPADKQSTTTTRIVGTGMFPNAAATVNVPKPDQATNLYIQLAGKKLLKGSYTAAQFKVLRNTTVLATITDNTLESKEYRTNAIFWYGTNLRAYDGKATKVNGELLVPANSVKNMPRALILYANYPTPNGEPYWNYVTRLNKSDKNHVYWGAGWIATQTHWVTLPAALTDARQITVQAALVDNDPDKRPVWLTIQLLGSSGNVLATKMFKPLGPTNGNMLNIFQPVLDAPVGTAKVRITLSSPNLTGDSVALVGVAVTYPCATPVR